MWNIWASVWTAAHTSGVACALPLGASTFPPIYTAMPQPIEQYTILIKYLRWVRLDIKYFVYTHCIYVVLWVVADDDSVVVELELACIVMYQHSQQVCPQRLQDIINKIIRIHSLRQTDGFYATE